MIALWRQALRQFPQPAHLSGSTSEYLKNQIGTLVRLFDFLIALAGHLTRAKQIGSPRHLSVIIALFIINLPDVYNGG
jgi:hypothetical protein